MTIEELQACKVRECSKNEAAVIIHRYEWLAKRGEKYAMPHFTTAYGLETTAKELAGVVVFFDSPLTKEFSIKNNNNKKRPNLISNNKYDKHKTLNHWSNFFKSQENIPDFLHRAVWLSRGACTHWAHKHAASFLISRACEMAYQKYGWVVFFAHSDSRAGEVGTVYQACNWLCLGKSPGRVVKTRNEWIYLPTEQVFTTRDLRRRLGREAKGCQKEKPHQWPFEEFPIGINISVLRKSPDWKCEVTEDKVKYIHFEGTKKQKKIAKKLLKYEIKEYPKRQVIKRVQRIKK